MKTSKFHRRTVIKQRILTGAVLLPLLILFIYFADRDWFNLFVYGISFIALWEFFGLSLPPGRKLEKSLAAVLGTILIPAALSPHPPTLLLGLTAVFFFFSILFLFRYQDLQTVARDLALLLFGFLYIPMLLGHLSLLRGLPSGREWIFLVLLIVMSGDTAAYFTGSSLGRRKLYPAISPKKSVEGALGGLAGSLAGALIARWWFFPALGIGDCLVLGFSVGILGQLGDLFESMLKRSFGVKDSGNIIPGHGGLLDRLDSLLFSFAPAYYYAIWLFR